MVNSQLQTFMRYFKAVRVFSPHGAFNGGSYLTVVNCCKEFITAQWKLRPVVAVHPLTGVVQMLEVMWRHCGGKSRNDISAHQGTIYSLSNAASFHISLWTHVLTLCDTAAETTLEAATSLYELHVRTHVGLATVAADRTALAVVHQEWRGLRRYSRKG